MTASARRLTLVATFVACSFALAYASRSVRAWRAEQTATRAAEWISAGDARRERSPNGYWLARDFTIEALPTSARLLALGDPEYVLWLNGRRVGSGAYAEGSALDAFEVAGLLQPGVNRLAVEVRSDRGPSGFLASLDDLSQPESRPLVVSDASWRVFRRFESTLLTGQRALEGGAPAYSWSRPPIGRWGEPLVGPLLPPFEAAVEALVRGTPSAPDAKTPPHHFVFHWDASHTGYLTIQFATREAPQLALLRFYASEPATEGPSSLPIPVIVLPARQLWLDAVPRTIRSIEVVGDVQVIAAGVAPLAPNAALAPRPAPKLSRGVWGLSAPPLRSPVEDEVGRQLERLASGGGREEL